MSTAELDVVTGPLRPIVGASLLPMREVRARVGLSQATIFRKVAAGQFPKPKKIGARALWFSPDIDLFVHAVATGIEWRPSMGQSMGQTED